MFPWHNFPSHSWDLCMSRESDGPKFSSPLCLFISGLQHEQSASHLFFTRKTKMMMTVAVSALHSFVQPFGKLEGPCVVVVLMEHVCVALKELFGP